jgi:hypothetical protein
VAVNDDEIDLIDPFSADPLQGLLDAALADGDDALRDRAARHQAEADEYAAQRPWPPGRWCPWERRNASGWPLSHQGSGQFHARLAQFCRRELARRRKGGA